MLEIQALQNCIFSLEGQQIFFMTIILQIFKISFILRLTEVYTSESQGYKIFHYNFFLAYPFKGTQAREIFPIFLNKFKIINIFAFTHYTLKYK